MQIFFTSDLHLGHKNAIRFDNRPFTNIDEMDNTIINNWKRKVKKDDLVYILGDISWYSDQKTAEILNQLPGTKILIKGNHDRVHGKVKHCFQEITSYKEIVINGHHIVLCHFPIVLFNRHHYGSYMFYGHVHNSYEYNMTQNFQSSVESLGVPCNMFNVGTMLWNYEPVTFDEIIAVKKKVILDEPQDVR